MHAQTRTIAFCSIETIAAIVQIHIASGLLCCQTVVNLTLVDVSKKEEILIYRLSLAYRAMPLLA